MLQRKSKKIFVYIFFFIFLGSINNQKILKSDSFKIKNFYISGLDNYLRTGIENNLYNNENSNIFFVNKEFLKFLLNSNSIVETFNVFKIYPSTLNIEIKKTNFLAKLNIDGDIFLIGTNGKLTDELELSHSEKLPFVFGNPKVEEFLEIFSIIKVSGFKYENIKNFFFYKSGRIDLEMEDNILLKLPKDDLKNVLKNIYQLISINKFEKKIIDARVPNQIILYD